VGRRWALAGCCLLSALLLSACYGSTEPATGIGEDSATLHARGSADPGPATSYFEYWTAGDPPTGYPTPRTPTRSWPAGASGPISEKVSDLLVASRYSFRLCGDDRGSTPVCAQTRSFTTPTPAGDYVKGSISVAEAPRVQPFAIRFNARSDPAGANVKGTMTTTEQDGSRNVWTVSCLKVTGSHAVGGFISPNGSAILLEVQTGRQSVGARTPVDNPPDCSSTQAFTSLPGEGSPVVHDAS
jgi:hypothetical protein